jgi:hypothetical protein
MHLGKHNQNKRSQTSKNKSDLRNEKHHLWNQREESLVRPSFFAVGS